MKVIQFWINPDSGYTEVYARVSGDNKSPWYSLDKISQWKEISFYNEEVAAILARVISG